MKLSDCKQDQTVKVIDSVDSIFARHGIVKGETITIINNYWLMPMQLIVRGSKIAIRKSLAALIRVELVESRI